MTENKDLNPQLSETAVSSSFSTDLCFENVELMLIENIAYFLDQEDVLIQESISELKDPIVREKTELHIRMAKAAMKEYKSTMLKQTSNWLSIVKTAYVVGLVGFPVEVNIDSLDYEKDIVNISTKDGIKATRKFDEIYQFYSDCDFR